MKLVRALFVLIFLSFVLGSSANAADTYSRPFVHSGHAQREHVLSEWKLLAAYVNFYLQNSWICDQTRVAKFERFEQLMCHDVIKNDITALKMLSAFAWTEKFYFTRILSSCSYSQEDLSSYAEWLITERGIIDIEKLTFLVQCGADVHYPDADGNTMLHCACMSRSEIGIDRVKAMIHTLVELGADPDIKNSAGQTAWDCIQDDDDEQILNFLDDKIVRRQKKRELLDIPACVEILHGPLYEEQAVSKFVALYFPTRCLNEAFKMNCLNYACVLRQLILHLAENIDHYGMSNCLQLVCPLIAQTQFPSGCKNDHVLALQLLLAKDRQNFVDGQAVTFIENIINLLGDKRFPEFKLVPAGSFSN
ncbi:MAG: hypothetical protein H6679_01505 [Epsilonproteobacteria bacterium]|nr:hypothetical protein [Campylobacterota bacterium]